jgi:FAD/FMN-containing dehydrogenase
VNAQPSIANFGGNIAFTPCHSHAPTTEAEVLDILDRHAQGKIRVRGALHSWSPAVVCDDVLIDLKHFDSVQIERDADGTVWATAGGGCRIKRLLDELQSIAGVTLPSVGLITEQTIAGAIATATHGSGQHSLSHYMAAIRVAAYDPDSGKARIFVWDDGPQLRAARCALGCMGVILSVKFRCVPQYAVEETVRRYTTLEEVLTQEADHPLQQFFLIPHAWSFYAQHRKECAVDDETGETDRLLRARLIRRSWHAGLYRAYWFLFIDVGMHLFIKLLAAWLRSPRLVRFFYRRVLPWTVWKADKLVDRSDVILTMEHELFRHLEIEIFVPARHVRDAARFVQQALSAFDGADIDPALCEALEKHGSLPRLAGLRGSFTFHYPITFRRVLPDDTLISMTADATEPYYAISFITYVEPRDAFYQLASFLADSMTALFQARLHWGKYFPLQHAQVAAAYPRLAEFREICRQTDPHGVFRNEFVTKALGFEEA